MSVEVIPRPGTDIVPDDWWHDSVVPWADEQIDELPLAEAAAHIAGMIAAYRTLNADTVELMKGRRYIEVRWGELLGEVTVGQRTDLQHSPASEGLLSKDERHRFRELAAHKQQVLEVLNTATEADEITRAAVLRATKPPKQTAGDTIDFLRSQATPTDPDTSEPVTRESLDEARARLKAAHQAEWSERQERILRRATDHLQTALDKMAAASTEALSAHAIGEIFRGAAAQARHGSAALDDLAFTFESMT